MFAIVVLSWRSLLIIYIVWPALGFGNYEMRKRLLKLRRWSDGLLMAASRTSKRAGTRTSTHQHLIHCRVLLEEMLPWIGAAPWARTQGKRSRLEKGMSRMKC